MENKKMQKSTKIQKNKAKMSKNSKYFDFYDDIKSPCHKIVDW